jgi:hypothetical protein
MMVLVGILLGIVALAGIIAFLVLAASTAASSVATAVGAGPFELFDVERPSSTWWKEVVIRGAGAIAPLVATVAVFTVENLVTPNDEGRIAIESKYERRPVAWTRALRTGLERPFQIVRATFSSAASSSSKGAEFAGPAGIVGETAKASLAGFGGFLSMVGLLGAYFWPAFPILHLLDSATLPAFRRKYPVKGADEGPVVTLATRRVARRLLAFDAVLVVWVLLMLLWALLKFGGLESSVFLPETWLFPLLFPPSWLLARSLYGPAKAALLGLGLFVPFLNLVLLFALSRGARAHMKEHGLASAHALPSARR